MGNVGCFIEVAGLVQELWCMDSKVKSPTWWQQENVFPCATVKFASFLTFAQTVQGQCFQRFIQQMVPKELLDDLVQNPCSVSSLWTNEIVHAIHTVLERALAHPLAKAQASQKVLFSVTVLEQVQVLKAATSCSRIVAPCSTTILRLSLWSQDVLKSARLRNAAYLGLLRFVTIAKSLYLPNRCTQTRLH